MTHASDASVAIPTTLCVLEFDIENPPEKDSSLRDMNLLIQLSIQLLRLEAIKQRKYSRNTKNSAQSTSGIEQS